MFVASCFGCLMVAVQRGDIQRVYAGLIHRCVREGHSEAVYLVRGPGMYLWFIETKNKSDQTGFSVHRFAR
jgi:hypothetical protein